MSSSAAKKVLVTGANKGIGRAICKTLLAKHSDVHVLLGSRDAARGENTIRELEEEVPGSKGRLDLIRIDTSSDESVRDAAEKVSQMGTKLFGIVNNAGIGFGNSFKDTLETNYFGPRRVDNAFGPQLIRPGGRIVNIASASGPMFVNSCGIPDLKGKLAQPLKFEGGINELDEIAKSFYDMLDYGNDAYGLSKALLNAYTALHAKNEPDLIINSCSPGFIDTDITAGMGATNSPEQGAVCPVHLLMSPELEGVPPGWYYGSDKVRSPLDRYRDPGDPPYEGP
eukprot:CAMPEP_0185731194 /NCGR_PEP_ID=MMETSP1171-20130828/12158_1 /TAXON_ID=374046 /ORGANISM="Helicotheca tamensis, Strain CCMP826" /LENGTH=282 /DNA_ID=CAMNT_0028400405 /DNA_START=153 /DNA_END=1001 /DNA_ORIENTATION=-